MDPSAPVPEDVRLEVNALLDQGYVIVGVDVGFLDSEAYDFMDSYMAILAKPGDLAQSVKPGDSSVFDDLPF